MYVPYNANEKFNLAIIIFFCKIIEVKLLFTLVTLKCIFKRITSQIIKNPPKYYSYIMLLISVTNILFSAQVPKQNLDRKYLFSATHREK